MTKKNFLNIVARSLGFGHLIDNVEFLTKLSSEAVHKKGVIKFTQNLKVNLNIVDKVFLEKMYRPGKSGLAETLNEIADALILLTKFETKLCCIIESNFFAWDDQQLSFLEFLKKIYFSSEFRKYMWPFFEEHTKEDAMAKFFYPKIDETSLNIIPFETNCCSSCEWQWNYSNIQLPQN